MKKLFKLLHLVFICLLSCGLTGCDEQSALEYLNKYGVQINGRDVTIEDVRRLFATYQSQISAETAALSTTTSSTETSTTRSQNSGISTADDTCENLITTSPRGIACLHCMQPEARTQANLIAFLLQRSCLKNIAINYLVDGTFSFDAEILYRHINILTRNGRRLFIYFYLTNGPSQRLYQETPIDALGTKTAPAKFRTLVKYDYETQYKFQLLVRRLIPFIRYASSKGAVVSLIPALEDNLDNESFDKLYQLALDALPYDISVAFGRNACEGCYSGNESGTPDGLFKEVHIAYPKFSLEDGVVTNDGRNYSSAVNPKNKGSVSLETLAEVRDRATLLNDTFILWDAERQGITTETKSMLVAPSDRKYIIPPMKERTEIIDFLRGGL